MRKMLFYGAGVFGKYAINRYKLYKMNRPELKGFLDRKPKDDYEGYPVYCVDDIRMSDYDIVITMSNPYEIWKVYKELLNQGCGKIYMFRNRANKVSENNMEFLTIECKEIYDLGECVLPYAEMHICDGCNLNCKGCTHFSPLFDWTMPSFDERIKDVKMLKSKFSNIFGFHILGGEPLLNPQLGMYVREIRKLLTDTYIEIVTNGLLIPSLSNEILQNIKENNVSIRISEYAPTTRLLPQIRDVLEQQGISYGISGFDDVKNMFGKPLSLSENSRYSHKCISPGCVNIWNGKIARCPTLMYIKKFNEKFGLQLPCAGILELNSDISGFNLLDFLEKEVPLCKHCVLNEFPWEQHKGEINLEDYVVID